MKKPLTFLGVVSRMGVLALAGALLPGCLSSTIEPLRPLRTEVYFVPASATVSAAATQDSGATQPTTAVASTSAAGTEPGAGALATAPATTAAATLAATLAATEPGSQPATMASTAMSTQPGTQPATQPLVKKTRIVDPNQTTRLVYRANYNRVWEQAMQLFVDMGYRVDRQDFREGVLTSHPYRGADIVEPLRADQTGAKSALENTVHFQQRTLRLTIRPVEGNSAYYEIAVQVLVERKTNPAESLGGEVFAEGSGFGHNPLALRSDYIPAFADDTIKNDATWLPVGHDKHLEKKILDHLFEKI